VKNHLRVHRSPHAGVTEHNFRTKLIRRLHHLFQESPNFLRRTPQGQETIFIRAEDHARNQWQLL